MLNSPGSSGILAKRDIADDGRIGKKKERGSTSKTAAIPKT
jgi:hypothetical protein